VWLEQMRRHLEALEHERPPSDPDDPSHPDDPGDPDGSGGTPAIPSPGPAPSGAPAQAVSAPDSADGASAAVVGRIRHRASGPPGSLPRSPDDEPHPGHGVQDGPPAEPPGIPEL
jgi:hypothetical protein